MRLGKREREAKRLTIAANLANKSSLSPVGRYASVKFETPRLRDGSFVQAAERSREISVSVKLLRF